MLLFIYPIFQIAILDMISPWRRHPIGGANSAASMTMTLAPAAAGRARMLGLVGRHNFTPPYGHDRIGKPWENDEAWDFGVDNAR